MENYIPKYLKVKTMKNDKGEIREYIDKPECSIGLVVDDLDHVLLVNQWRVGCQSRICEAVGGLVDEGETPKQAMIRELREETGIEEKYIKQIVQVDRCYSETGYSTEICNLFIIQLKDGYVHCDQKLDKGEDLTYDWYSTTMIDEMFYNTDNILPMKTKHLLDVMGDYIIYGYAE